MRSRQLLKSVLAAARVTRPAQGATLLIYHRIGGTTSNELDLSSEAFMSHASLLAGHDVVSLDDALDRMEVGDANPSFVLTFDDGFQDVYENAWPVLRDLRLPFTIYLASAFVGKAMRWEDSTARGDAGQGLTWEQLGEMVESGLCTVGNHTHTHVRPEKLNEAELDRCSAAISTHLGSPPRHFTYPWGIPMPTMDVALRDRFRSASTGELGRNLPGVDLMRLRRVPVRRSDPERFFAAKLVGDLGPERAYGRIVAAGKQVGLRG